MFDMYLTETLIELLNGLRLQKMRPLRDPHPTFRHNVMRS